MDITFQIKILEDQSFDQCLPQIVKIFLILELKKIGFFIALILNIYMKFLNLLFLDKFKIVLLALLLPLTISLLLVLNNFGAKFDNLITFNNRINSTTTLLKS